MEMEQTKHAEMNAIVEKMILALMPEEDQDDEEKREAARDAYEFAQNRQNNKARASSDYMRGELSIERNPTKYTRSVNQQCLFSCTITGLQN